MLRDFLDRFGFDYEFVSSTDYYRAGRFDDALKRRAAPLSGDHGHHAADAARRARRDLFAGAADQPEDGIVLQVPVEVVDAEAGIDRASTMRASGSSRSILRRQAKLQWKVDWAMRWVALGVDYEMAGKDLIDSVIQSGKIARVLGGRPPEGFNYEMFLDEKGEKISKSKGNGLSLDQWLTYGPRGEPRLLHLSRAEEGQAAAHGRDPARGGRLLAVPRQLCRRRRSKEKLGNPVHHVHDGKVPTGDAAGDVRAAAQPGRGDGAMRPRSRSGAISAIMSPDATPETYPELDRLIDHALAYDRDFVAPTLKRRAPEGVEVAALREARRRARRAAGGCRAPRTSRTSSMRSARPSGFENLRDWFKALYETLLGSSQGPRMGSFIALYGIANSRKLIAEALAR